MNISVFLLVTRKPLTIPEKKKRKNSRIPVLNEISINAKPSATSGH